MADTVTTYVAELCRVTTGDRLQRIGVALVYQFTGNHRKNRVGEWTLTFQEPALEAGATVYDIGAVIIRNQASGGVVYAGLHLPGDNQIAGLTRIIEPSGTTYELSGVDVFGILATRRAWPQTEVFGYGVDGSNSEGRIFWADDYDRRGTSDGRVPASTAARRYIEGNLGGAGGLYNIPEAGDDFPLGGYGTIYTPRNVANIVFVDPGIGDIGRWEARLERLDDTIGDLCEAADIVCLGTYTNDDEWLFEFRQPQDRTGTARISSARLAGGKITIVEPGPRATNVIAGGSGQLVNRLFASFPSYANGGTGLRRVEDFYELTNLSTVRPLYRAARARQQSLEQPYSAQIEAPVSVLDYPVDYELGDTISVEDGNQVIEMTVTGVTFDIGSDQSLIQPVLGTAPVNNAQAVLSRLARRGQTADRRGTA